MEHTHTINGLLLHRSQVAGEVEFHRAKAQQAAELVGSVDRVLRSLGYEANDITAPPTRVQAAGLFRRGELSRLIMSALREAPEGLTVHAIADMICAERGWETDDQKWMTAFRSKIGRALGAKKSKGKVTSEDRGGTWYWCPVPLVPTVEAVGPASLTPPAASSLPTGGLPALPSSDRPDGPPARRSADDGDLLGTPRASRTGAGSAG